MLLMLVGKYRSFAMHGLDILAKDTPRQECEEQPLTSRYLVHVLVCRKKNAMEDATVLEQGRRATMTLA